MKIYQIHLIGCCIVGVLAFIDATHPRYKDESVWLMFFTWLLLTLIWPVSLAIGIFDRVREYRAKGEADENQNK